MSLPALPSTADIRSITERVNAIIKNIYNLVIPVGAANTVLTSDGTTLAWAALPVTGATTFLAGNVALNNTGNFFNGPNTGSIGASGQVWLITATGTATDTANAQIVIQIHDGTSAIIGTTMRINAGNVSESTTLSKVVTLSAATTFTLQARDPTTVNGTLQTTASGTGSPANLATSITAVRLA